MSVESAIEDLDKANSLINQAMGRAILLPDHAIRDLLIKAGDLVDSALDNIGDKP